MKKLFSLLVLLGGPAAWATDALSVEAGYGYHTDMARLSWSRAWDQKWFADHAWFLSGYWDASLGRWTPHNPAGGNHDVTDIGLTPVWRLRPSQGYSLVTPFLEAAVGVHYLSDHDIYAGRNMTTHFQFGDHVGAGVSFGAHHDWDLMARLQHLSNAGLQNPNPGINFYQVRLGHWY